MTFRELETWYRQLMLEQVAGQLNPQQFMAAADQLRCLDPQGRLWRIEASSGSWQVWDGYRWQEASPLLDGPALPVAQAQQVVPGSPHDVGRGAPAAPLGYAAPSPAGAMPPQPAQPVYAPPHYPGANAGAVMPPQPAAGMGYPAAPMGYPAAPMGAQGAQGPQAPQAAGMIGYPAAPVGTQGPHALQAAGMIGYPAAPLGAQGPQAAQAAGMMGYPAAPQGAQGPQAPQAAGMMGYPAAPQGAQGPQAAQAAGMMGYPAAPMPGQVQQHPTGPQGYAGMGVPIPPPPRGPAGVPPWLMAAEAQLQRIIGDLASGRLHPASAEQAFEQLKVQDPAGGWWRPKGAGGGWVAWNGQAWVNAPFPSIPMQAGVAGAVPSGPSTSDGDKLDLNAEKGKPLAARSEKWWDLVAVAGGTLCGWVWFVYSAVRGMPQLKVFGPAQRESIFDFFLPMVLLAIPLLLLPLRRVLFSLFQKTPLVIKILGGLFLAFIAITIQHDTLILNQREGLDFITPLLMTGIPLMFTWLRGPIDRMLTPLQAVRRHIPRPLVVGAGLAIPFLTAFVLYYLFRINQYPLLRWNVLLGLVLSYLVLRTPKPRKPQPSGAAGVTAALTLVALVVVWFAPTLAWADDFLRDPFNLNDGLRTPGIAVAISGVATTVVTMLINGIEVVRVFITPPPGSQPAGDDKGPPQQSAFLVVVRTVDTQGMMSTTLDQQKNPAIFVYAHCEQVGKGAFPQGDPTIRFALMNAQEVVSCEDLGTAYGERSARVSFLPQLRADAQLPPTCVVQVSAGAGGGLISAPVTLQLVADLILAAEVVNGERRLPIDPSRPTFCVRFDPKTKQWQLGEIVLYFHTPDSDQPIRPPFQVLWQPITANPPYLEFDAPVSDDGGLTWRLRPRFKRGVEIPDAWLMTKGEIELDLPCMAVEGP